MIEKDQIHQIVAEILESPEFKDSKRSQELLQYLVQSTIDGKSPKEITIAIEFFGKDSGFDPKEHTTVRVQINGLRKEIKHCYLTTKNPRSHKLEIPKDHYAVEFVPSSNAAKTAPGSRRLTAALVTLIVALSSVIVWMVVDRHGKSVTSERSFATNPLWTEFLQPAGKPTLIVLGEYFFLFDKSFTEKPGMIVRNQRINSLENLRAATSKDPAFAKRYVQSDFTFLRPSAPWSVAEILPILGDAPQKTSLKLASQLTPDDLKQYNVIFVGSFKTLHKLNRILHHFDLKYQLLPPEFTINAQPPDSSITFHSENVRGGEYERDYAVIAKGVGPEGNTIMLILGFGDSGVLQAAKVAADRSLIKKIELEHGSASVAAPFNCILVIEAEGINQTGFRTALKYFRRVSPAQQDLTSR
jgi:hypothetical protein